MSQVTTLYRVSQDTFRQLQETADRQQLSVPDTALDDYSFQGSEMALDFLLSKGKDEDTAAIIRQIFYPEMSLGGPDPDSTPEEQLEHYEGGSWIPYHSPEMTAAIHRILEGIAEADIDATYNAAELNKNGIYPRVWHNDNTPDMAYNKIHIQEDLVVLKRLFRDAAAGNNIIISFPG